MGGNAREAQIVIDSPTAANVTEPNATCSFTALSTCAVPKQARELYSGPPATE